VASACHSLGRGDLVECAELGISELVTNALLHGEEPIAVHVRGTAEHLRLEVCDGSREPPVLPTAISREPDDLLLTVGRGLNIVAMCSVSWGAAIDEAGKCVWFEPATAPHEDVYPLGEVFVAEQTAPWQPPAGASASVISLPGLPLHQLGDQRRHYQELRRELRLLSLARQDDFPLADNLTRVFKRFERALPRTMTTQINAALARGDAVTDLSMSLDPDTASVIEQMLDLLDLADEFCRAKRLLSLARTPRQREFQQWYFGEFIRQSRGEPPRAWAPTGPGRSGSKHVS